MNISISDFVLNNKQQLIDYLKDPIVNIANTSDWYKEAELYPMFIKNFKEFVIFKTRRFLADNSRDFLYDDLMVFLTPSLLERIAPELMNVNFWKENGVKDDIKN